MRTRREIEEKLSEASAYNFRREGGFVKYIEDMDFREYLDWAQGYLLIAIGKGEFKQALYTVIEGTCRNKHFGGGRKKKP